MCQYDSPTNLNQQGTVWHRIFPAAVRNVLLSRLACETTNGGLRISLSGAQMETPTCLRLMQLWAPSGGPVLCSSNVSPRSALRLCRSTQVTVLWAYWLRRPPRELQIRGPVSFTFHQGFVHPLQNVALHQCHPLSSVCCFLVPGGSFLPFYVVLPSSRFLREDFSGSSHTSELTIGTPVANLPGAWSVPGLANPASATGNLMTWKV